MRLEKRKTLALAAALCLCAALLCGCTATEEALRGVGQRLSSGDHDVETPQNDGGLDWSFVPAVRETAVATFTEAFPEAEITETNVSTRNGRDDRVIVLLTYTLSGKSGEYGFDYEKDEQGDYVLKRYGEGVRVDDL